jgi:hypothetical protein
MNNSEKLTTLGTQYTKRRQTKQKHNTIRVGHHYTQTNTNNINKTPALLQTGGKDKPNIVCMRITQRTSQHETQNVKTHNRTTQKTKKMSNIPGVNLGAREG